MPSSIQKLSPHRDLQCFFFQPSAIAALSNATPTGFMLSGTWRQQFDWAVVEWNRDNVYEHPAFRTLPDGDLSGLTLTYEETRTNCIPLDSALFATVDWPSLRIWGPKDGVERIFYVRLTDHAVPIDGTYQPAFADFTLTGSATPAAGTYAGLAYLDTHYTYSFDGSHTTADALVAIRDVINLRPNPFQPTLLRATISGSTIRVYYTGGPTVSASSTGLNGNRFGMYSYSTTAAASWDIAEKAFAGGTSPTKWLITLPFGSLQGHLSADFTDSLVDIPSGVIRKMRWTYAADLQPGLFSRSEFQVVVSNWGVAGANRIYSLAGPGSRRIDNISPEIVYHDNLSDPTSPALVGALSASDTTLHLASPSSAVVGDTVQIDSELLIVTGVLMDGLALVVSRAAKHSVASAHSVGAVVSLLWSEQRGNYFGGSIHRGAKQGDRVTYTYRATDVHTLFLGTRYTNNGAAVNWLVDGSITGTLNLQIAGEDTLIRWSLGTYGSGNHTVTVASSSSGEFFFDFFELAIPTTSLPVFPVEQRMTLATDWDTLHSVALPPERTAWFIQSLGFTGRQNHYVGALLFYELVPVGYTSATSTVTFSGTINITSGNTVTLRIGNDSTADTTDLFKLLHVGDTPDLLAIAFAQQINSGSTGIWASAVSGVLSITARLLGSGGSHSTLRVDSVNNSALTITVSGTANANGFHPFSAAVDGEWRTDLTATPRLNRAVRDWNVGFATALRLSGIDMVAAFSMELGNGDDSVAAGIAQRGPSGDPILLPTPALQTNFSPTSLAFWQDVYLGMADLQAAAGLVPYLQFGEVQWWYFPNDGLVRTFSGMPFYDAWTKSQFQTQYGHPLSTITTNNVNPADYADEVAFLPKVLGDFTSAIIAHVRATYPACRFEVLYPTDVNQTIFNQAINYPIADWTPAKLDNLKTEAFGFTFGKNLDKSIEAIHFGSSLGFPAAQRSHLIGIADAYAAWRKEAEVAQGSRLESVVLFALDQFCLIGYSVPVVKTLRRVIRVGG